MDTGMNKEYTDQCDALVGVVEKALEVNPRPMQVGVLFHCILNVTKNQPCEMWAPILAAFVAAIAKRDGIFINCADIDDDDDDAEPPHITLQ